MIEILAFIFCILFTIYISFGLILHIISLINSSKKGLGYIIAFFYCRALLFLGPSFLLFTDNINWAVYTTGPIKVTIIPLLYLYFTKLNSDNKNLSKRDLVHFIPFIFELLFTLPIAYFHAAEVVNPENIKITSILEIQWDNHFYYNLLAATARSIALLQAIIYAFLISKKYLQLKKTYLEQNSFLSFTNLKWIKRVSYLLIATGFMSGFELFGLFANPIFFILTALFIIFTAFFFLIHSILQNDLHQSSNLNYPKNNPINNDKKNTENAQDTLSQFIENELYLKTDICLQEASYQLGIAKYKLTEHIKLGGYDNFYHFVNQMRIDKSKTLLKTITPQFSIESVVTVAGFNSRSTFYRVFKEYTGMTPTEYIKESKENPL